MGPFAKVKSQGRSRSNTIVKPQLKNDSLSESLVDPLDTQKDDVLEDKLTGSEEGGTKSTEVDGNEVEVKEQGGKTEVDLDLTDPKGSDVIQNVVQSTTKGNDPQFKKMRVMMYTPATGSGHELDNLSGGSGVANRLKLLEENLAAANEVADNANDGPDVLRLFMAPEWFFSHKNGAYNGDEMSEAIRGLEAISKKFPNVMLVPGSILWTENVGKDVTPPPPKKKGISGFFSKLFEKKKQTPTGPQQAQMLTNTSGAFVGGKALHLYHKQRDGTDSRANDKIQTPSRPTLSNGTKNDHLDWVNGDGGKTERAKGSAGHTFEYGGLRFGMEICADHGSGLLMRELHDKNKDDPGVDIHLVTACGAGSRMDDKTISSRKGGYGIYADGSRSQDFQAEKMVGVTRVTDRQGSLREASKQISNRKGEEEKSVKVEDQKMNKINAKKRGEPQGTKTANLLRVTDLLDL